MGLNPLGASSSVWDTVSPVDSPEVRDAKLRKLAESRTYGNPDPKRYIIRYMETWNELVIVCLTYLDSINYEGTKILVYRNVTEALLRQAELLDPHFSDNPEILSPIARFVPTAEGFDMAQSFCKFYMTQ